MAPSSYVIVHSKMLILYNILKIQFFSEFTVGHKLLQNSFYHQLSMNWTSLALYHMGLILGSIEC
jgi:hypothetical protein